MTEKPRRYAEGTKVEVVQTKADIERLVMRHGATGFLSAWMDEEGDRSSMIQFRLYERMLKYRVPFPGSKDVGAETSSGRPLKSEAVAARIDQEWRRRWRALFLIVKAKLEIVASGDSTFDREFLADLLTPDGTTVGDDVLPKLIEACRTGTMPPLLPAGEQPRRGRRRRAPP